MKYVLEKLKDRKPRPGYEDIYQEKVDLHYKRMEGEVTNDAEELSLAQFEDSLTNIAKKNKDKYKTILQAGNSIHKALFALLAGLEDRGHT